MGHKAYISFKTEDVAYKQAIQKMPYLDYVDKSLNEPIMSNDEDYIMRAIRSEYLYDSTVSIFLIGAYSAEYRGAEEQRFIKRELQSSLYTSSLHAKNGILGVVLPHMVDAVYGGTYACHVCGASHNSVSINDATVIKEFSYNYYIPNGKCAHVEDDRYCVLTTWNEFSRSPEHFINLAFEKRSAPIALKVRVRP